MGCGPSSTNSLQTNNPEQRNIRARYPDKHNNFTPNHDTRKLISVSPMVDGVVTGYDQNQQKREGEKETKEYTMDEIIEHNKNSYSDRWFRYGKKVYNANTLIQRLLEMEPVKSAFTEHPYGIPDTWHLHTPIQTVVITYGIKTIYMKRALPKCEIGNLVQFEKEYILPNMLQSVKNTLEEVLEMPETNNLLDLKDQLMRWLMDYPNVNVENGTVATDMDPNNLEFPLHKTVKSDRLSLRKTLTGWEPFNTDVEGEAAWDVIATNTVKNDITTETQEITIKQRELRTKLHNDLEEKLPEQELEPFDMNITGEAAWDVIEPDVVKNDITTEAQENTLRQRKKRTNLTDEKWMEKRRKQIAESFISRHEMDPNKVQSYLLCCENLTASWKRFLALL